MVTSGATIRGRGKAKSSAPPFVPAGAPARRASKSPQRSRGGYPGVVRRSGSVRVTRDFPERRVIRVVDDPRGILSDSRYRPVGGTLNLHKNHQPHPHRPTTHGHRAYSPSVQRYRSQSPTNRHVIGHHGAYPHEAPVRRHRNRYHAPHAVTVGPTVFQRADGSIASGPGPASRRVHDPTEASVDADVRNRLMAIEHHAAVDAAHSFADHSAVHAAGALVPYHAYGFHPLPHGHSMIGMHGRVILPTRARVVYEGPDASRYETACTATTTTRCLREPGTFVGACGAIPPPSVRDHASDDEAREECGARFGSPTSHAYGGATVGSDVRARSMLADECAWAGGAASRQWAGTRGSVCAAGSRARVVQRETKAMDACDDVDACQE